VAADEVELSGHIAWTDFDPPAPDQPAVLPARHVNVDIWDLSAPFGPTMFGRVQTDDNGDYHFTFKPASSVITEHQIQIRVWAEDPDVARVASPNSPEGYSQWATREVTLCTAKDINYTAPNDTDFGKAFAIHDALWSAHLYAGMVGGGDEARIGVLWPSPIDGDTSAKTDEHGMYLGDYEWSSWDVINRRARLWAARTAGSAVGGGGRESNPPDPDTGPLRF
jgi:hypothetical protein